MSGDARCHWLFWRQQLQCDLAQSSFVTCLGSVCNKGPKAIPIGKTTCKKGLTFRLLLPFASVGSSRYIRLDDVFFSPCPWKSFVGEAPKPRHVVFLPGQTGKLQNRPCHWRGKSLQPTLALGRSVKSVRVPMFDHSVLQCPQRVCFQSLQSVIL